MKNIRNLKKDINYLTEIFVSDCFLSPAFYPVKDIKEIESLSNNIVNERNNLFSLINNPENKGEKNLRKNKLEFKLRNKANSKNLNKAFEDFVGKIDNGYTELKKLIYIDEQA